MNAAVLIPVKETARAKSRMAPLLSPEERTLLAASMFEDLVQSLLPLRCPVAVVTRSPSAAARVKGLGWHILWEEKQVSESVSVDEASRILMRGGIDAVLRLPADLPLLRTEDVDALLSVQAFAPSAVLVPSRDGTGTNALMRTPPDLFPSHFGPGSFARHCLEAASAGADVRIIENPRLALDLDEPDDIARLLELSATGETCRTLIRLHIEERLARHAARNDPDPRA